MSSYSLKFLSSRVIGIKVSSINLVKPVLNGLGLFFQVPQVNPCSSALIHSIWQVGGQGHVFLL